MVEGLSEEEDMQDSNYQKMGTKHRWLVDVRTVLDISE